jgi:hypothetical protein
VAAPDQQLVDMLRQARRDALDVADSMGRARLLRLLRKADADVTQRLARVSRAAGGPGRGTFTSAQLEVTRRQVRLVVRELTRGLGSLVVDQAADVAEESAGRVLEYLGRAEKAFRGVASRPLALREASILDEAVSGTNATVLRRLAGEGGPEGAGILERYGVETVGRFEEVMRIGLLARKDWADVRNDLVEQSPFLEGAPKSWSERILRNETTHAMNRSAWEAQNRANQELGDLVKINIAVFDDRTAADSYAVHGQIRRNEEPFETWYGLIQHPPDRPNDRSSFVPHRISWPIPPALAWRDGAQIAARWKAEGRKGSPPPRPRMTTVPLSEFGKGA